jgi:hypothetical protein
MHQFFIQTVKDKNQIATLFRCRMLSAKLTEEEGSIKPFYIDLRDTPTFITEKDIVRQPYLEEKSTSMFVAVLMFVVDNASLSVDICVSFAELG